MARTCSGGENLCFCKGIYEHSTFWYKKLRTVAMLIKCMRFVGELYSRKEVVKKLCGFEHDSSSHMHRSHCCHGVACSHRALSRARSNVGMLARMEPSNAMSTGAMVVDREARAVLVVWFRHNRNSMQGAW